MGDIIVDNPDAGWGTSVITIIYNHMPFALYTFAVKNNTWVKQATAEVADGALNIKFSGKGWSGAGLNWQGYWPAGSGIKVSDYKFLIIQLKAIEKAN